MWCSFYKCLIEDVNYKIQDPICDMCCARCKDCLDLDKEGE